MLLGDFRRASARYQGQPCPQVLSQALQEGGSGAAPTLLAVSEPPTSLVTGPQHSPVSASTPRDSQCPLSQSSSHSMAEEQTSA